MTSGQPPGRKPPRWVEKWGQPKPKPGARMSRREWVRLLLVMAAIVVLGVLLALVLGGSGKQTRRQPGDAAVSAGAPHAAQVTA